MTGEIAQSNEAESIGPDPTLLLVDDDGPFLRRLARGRHSVSYRVRAEIPGTFSALPTIAYAMYAPELKGNSDEIKIRIVDQE